jgi:hypothetical protein
LFRTAAMPELFHSSEMKCPFRVNRAILAVCRSLPIYPDKQTFSESGAMSQRCHKLTSHSDPTLCSCDPETNLLAVGL